MIYSSKRIYEKHIIKKNLKRFYNYIRLSVNTKVSIPQLENEQQNITCINTEVADIFATTFTQEPDIERLPEVNDTVKDTELSADNAYGKIINLDLTKFPGQIILLQYF